MAMKLFTRGGPGAQGVPRKRKRGSPDEPDFNPAPTVPLTDDSLERLLQQGRYCTILREEQKWRSHARSDTIIAKAKEQLEARMALVPAGNVVITQTLTAEPGASEDEIDVRPFLLDVHTVTNARFQKFVDDGGYDALEYWPEDIWPHLIELKDQTGEPGPRYWRQGRHDERLADHPVVGVSWFEAQAYALWIGQRLPTEAEWQMAACWHINSSADLLRRFPWGDALDNTRCNIWSSRRRSTVPVTEYPKGAAPNHVLQLVGNVWEWIDSEYSIADNQGRQIFGEMPMQVIRGGAFDTYFETQATSQFRTGQITLARRHNCGFRCAIELDQASWINGS